MVVSLAATLAAVEVFVRVSGLYVDRTTDKFEYYAGPKDGGVGFTYKSNLDRDWAGIRLRTNSLGLKETREPADFDPKCRRILMVGGSITAGYGIEDDRAFPRTLESALNTRGEGCYHVINAGQIAYTASDSAALLRALTPIYKPDLVIFELNQFAMNSPYFINKNGQLQNGIVENVVYDHLAQFWVLKDGRVSIDAPVSGERSFWARGEWDRSSWWDHSYALQFFRPRLLSLLARLGLRGVADCGDRCLELRPTYLTKTGATERLPIFSPLYVSPVYRARFYQTVNEVIAETKTPLVFLLNDFFTDPARMTSRADVSIVNLSEVVGMPTKKLYDENSLSWDFHLNENGTELVGRGLAKFLAARGLVPGTAARTLDGSTEEFIAANRRHDASVVARFLPAVDVAGHRYVHQIVGGLTPDERATTQRLALLLRKSGQRKFAIRGEGFAEAAKRFELRLFSESGELTNEVTIAPGEFEIALRADAVGDGLVDVWLTCLEEACSYNRYDLIGFE